MNRRNFISLSVTSAALLTHRMSAQTSTTSGVFISELTDSEWDYSESGFELSDHTYAPENSFERVIFRTETGTLTFEMGATGSADMAKYLLDIRTQYNMLFGTVEERGEGTSDAGGWMAFGVPTNAGMLANYNEYQVEAFPGFDMVIQYSTDATIFQGEFAKVQSMNIGGLPPFAFAEESKVAEIVFTTAAASNTSATTRTQRNARSSTTTTVTEATSTVQSAGTGNDPAFAAAVYDHHTAFHALLDEFYEKLEATGVEGITEADKSVLMVRMANIAIEWQGYPAQALGLTVPAGSEALGTLYTDWANAIGEMGVTFEQFLMYGAAVDPFLAAVAAWEPLDLELEAILSEFSGSVTTGSISYFQIWRAIH